jgi:uncharacterized protein DUF4430
MLGLLTMTPLRRAARAALVAVTIVGAAGCGLGANHGRSSPTTLTVTRDFGANRVSSTNSTGSGSETVIQALERSFHVVTRADGADATVQSIDGLSAGTQREWSFYVNGVAPGDAASAVAVHEGDTVWWDLHAHVDASSSAVVGSFPEPFVHGVGGKRLPTTLECAAEVTAACNQVAKTLGTLGIPVASQLLGTGSGTDSIGVVVGTWSDIRPELVGTLIEAGPKVSGVYASFTGGGRALQLLDPLGRVAAVLRAGAGLIAATAQNGSGPIWLVTGTDPAGVQAAASALTPARLQDHFALAVDGAQDLPLPTATAGAAH